MYKVDNAVIMAAGTSSRFAPLSYEKPKALTMVRDEILIERESRQLQEAGVPEIYIVTSYKREQFRYLQDVFHVKLLYNPDYLTRNNNASIYAAKDVIKNTYICSADNYFLKNPFEAEAEEAYYSAVYTDGDNSATGFTFRFHEHTYRYSYQSRKLSIIFSNADMEDVNEQAYERVL